ncbi:ABC transporter ATP-binding protein [Solibacillus sp. R5-41]|uniref:ABC transporter ATP-binding protein n=1 Tax=Solibacillus sp. R5-41 TaxID=2048654 RepID=UPI000C128F0A|nr:ABC transporter ATP-binding protein [Solibacillus sp. R5-41]ATP38658.1 ABC transporter ATP-binding protein [Solibacillus sp. R5-41]
MSQVVLNKIQKVYQNKPVLDDIKLHIEDGEFLTILGPSGCGKSTILRIITGLVEPEFGDVTIDEQRVNNVPVKERNVGMVFQQYALFPNLTVYENIAFGLRVKKETEANIQQEVDYLLQLVGLEEKSGSYPQQLSGGQQQRVALARALAVKPKVLLLDEPLSALDAQIRKKLQVQLRQIQQELKMTMVLVTHDQDEAMNVSDRIVVMNNGKIEQLGTPTEIYTHPKTEFIAKFIGNYNVFSRRELEAIIGQKLTAQGERFAIRPEVIVINSEQPGIKTRAIAKNILMKGNVLKIDFEANGQVFQVEQLHQQGNQIDINRDYILTIAEDDVISLI